MALNIDCVQNLCGLESTVPAVIANEPLASSATMFSDSLDAAGADGSMMILPARLVDAGGLAVPAGSPEKESGASTNESLACLLASVPPALIANPAGELLLASTGTEVITLTQTFAVKEGDERPMAVLAPFGATSIGAGKSAALPISMLLANSKVSTYSKPGSEIVSRETPDCATNNCGSSRDAAVKIPVFDLQSAALDPISQEIIAAGLDGRRQLFLCLKAALSMLPSTKGCSGADNATNTILALHMLPVDSHGVISPHNTFAGGRQLAYAATYIGDVLPPDLMDTLKAAGASERFLKGYESVRSELTALAEAALNAKSASQTALPIAQIEASTPQKPLEKSAGMTSNTAGSANADGKRSGVNCVPARWNQITPYDLEEFFLGTAFCLEMTDAISQILNSAAPNPTVHQRQELSAQALASLFLQMSDAIGPNKRHILAWLA